MKRLLSALSVVSLSLLLCQCAGTSTAPASTASAAAESADEGDAEIKAGMTKAQVIEVWNEPDSKTPLPGGGEVWKWAGQGWKRSVPVYGAWAHVEEHTVTFGPDGKVAGKNTKDFGNAFQEPGRRR